MATSELVCGPIMICAPRRSRSLIASSAFEGSVSIANKKMEPISTVLATRICLELFFGNLQRCNRVYPKARPGSSQRSEHANLEHSPRMRFVRLICSCRTNESENESTSDSTKDDANFHKFASILASATLSRMTLSGVEFLVA